MIKLLITDLDDTLYSWIGFFVPAFYEMVKELSVMVNKPIEELLKEYKQVHQEKGSVEYPYATLHLQTVKKIYGNYDKKDIVEALNPVFHKFNSVRKNKLQLFPGVKETLEYLSNKGIVIVGYTDSAEENGFYRLKKLGIDKLFRKVYVSNSQYMNTLGSSEKIVVVKGKKPNSQVIEQICKKEKIDLKEAIYVGDSLTKDIYMAHMAGIKSILCQYPKVSDFEELYSKLVAITNWTEEDFVYEKMLKSRCKTDNITPDYVVNSFDKIVKIIEKYNS